MIPTRGEKVPSSPPMSKERMGGRESTSPNDKFIAIKKNVQLWSFKYRGIRKECLDKIQVLVGQCDDKDLLVLINNLKDSVSLRKKIDEMVQRIHIIHITTEKERTWKPLVTNLLITLGRLSQCRRLMRFWTKKERVVSFSDVGFKSSPVPIIMAKPTTTPKKDQTKKRNSGNRNKPSNSESVDNGEEESSGNPPQDDSRCFKCRICENIVVNEMVVKHSEQCMKASKIESEMRKCDTKIKKAQKEIESIKQTLENNPLQEDYEKSLNNIKNLCETILLSSKSSLEDMIKSCKKSLKSLKSISITIPNSGKNNDNSILKIYSNLIIIISNKISQLKLREDVPIKYNPEAKKFSIQDFIFLKPINKGAFGKVFLAKRIATGDIYAIKVLDKIEMFERQQVGNIKNERDIMQTTTDTEDVPKFLLTMFHSFQTKTKLYMVMEYMPGGDLLSLLNALVYFDEEMAKHYIAEATLAIEYLHSIGITHRDIKPDNLLIDKVGHLKLIDFGLSKVGLIDQTFRDAEDIFNDQIFEKNSNNNMNFHGSQHQVSVPRDHNTNDDTKTKHKRFSFVGTPDYLAPEIILCTGHSSAVDWWSLGVMLFELLTGFPPFNAKTKVELFSNIINRNIPWHIVPKNVSSSALDLINKLLHINPLERLGANGAEEVKSHEFFKGIDWENLYKSKAPFLPRILNEEDTRYFSIEKSDLPPVPQRDNQNDDSDSDGDNDLWEGFYFTNFSQLLGKNLNVVNNDPKS